ncbi:group II intron maturase-specific domain-containing protein [Bacteroides ihuae]|uniref:group II intron maturase-specific domain-containing protein n=1 Tax=Bacteroides ihuae TaxID=1852362 RepID=UPI0008DA1267|nr:group II intron maturase-specific domain-containing protein [Bacteroides ihuae]
MNLHKWRTTLEHIAREINPILNGIINYYHKFRKSDMTLVWLQLNGKLLKWIKWEKGLANKAAGKYLHTKYKQNTNLFAHWALVHP